MRECDSGVRLANRGSVGFPYEAESGAYWALLDADVELRRTSYDLSAALAVIAATGIRVRTTSSRTWSRIASDRPG